MKGKPDDLSHKGKAFGVRMRRYRAIAARALGRPLKPTEQVHHHTQTQLVICENHQYHKYLHTRERIVKAGGNPNTHAICSKCRGILDLTAFSPNRAAPYGRNQMCKECERERRRLPRDHPRAQKLLGPRTIGDGRAHTVLIHR